MKLDSDDYATIGLAVAVGFCLGCHLGSYFLSGFVLVVVVVALVRHAHVARKH